MGELQQYEARLHRGEAPRGLDADDTGEDDADEDGANTSESPDPEVAALSHEITGFVLAS